MRLKIDKKDVFIMLAMTIIYFVFALINLGTTKVPQNGYIPKQVGETFTVKFDRKRYVNRINYYCGLGVDRDVKVTMKVTYKDSDGSFKEITNNGNSINVEKKAGEVFKLKDLIIDGVLTDTLKFEVLEIGGELKELAIYEFGASDPIREFWISDYQNKDVINLFDEQDKMPFQPTYKNSTYFDEIYHARTAYEHLHHIKQYENTHPPLGKLLIALGIKIFGMTPFGWRIMGTLFGALMIPAMYLFGLKVFGKKLYAFCCAFLMMFDFMHFTQTRIATIDVFVTFFIIMMYYYMFDVYMNESLKNPKVYYRSFALAGLMWGLGIASKWIALYASVGLFLLFVVAKYKEYCKVKNNELIKKDIIKVLIYGTTFFVVIPVIIYVCSYIPVLKGEDLDFGLVQIVALYQQHMYNYHSHTVLTATHPFSSHWYQWPIIQRPIWYYANNNFPDGLRSTIVALGNPVIWWLSIVAFVFTIIKVLTKKDKKMIPIVVAALCQYVPWMSVERTTFIYHFFSIVPFGIIMIVYMFEKFIKDDKKKVYALYGYLALVFIAFVVFYPALSGMLVSGEYINKLRLFKSWVF